MQVIATAGHVDHGKSALVRALTGMEPDRWEQEQRRGLSIDLGFAWLTQPDGERLAFVDVPGHERFVPNMLAGVGPVPAVLFVVAADGGWMPQSAEHLAAIDALGITRGLLAVTRADLADPGPATRAASAEIGRSSLGEIPAVAVSAVTGAGLTELRAALAGLAAGLPAPDPAAPVRLWLDRVFSVTGSGTVVTGTLAAGTLRTGDELLAAPAQRPVRIRGIQSLKQKADEVTGVARVALNLRGTAPGHLARGMALTQRGGWTLTSLIDVRLAGDREIWESGQAPRLPRQVTVHIGSARAAARVRPLGGPFARLSLAEPLPLHVADRLLLRDPGAARAGRDLPGRPAGGPAGQARALWPAITGAIVLDVRPPARKTGAAAIRRELSDWPAVPGAGHLLRRHRLIRSADLQAMGIALQPAGAQPEVPAGAGAQPPASAGANPPAAAVCPGAGWLADPGRWAELRDLLAHAVEQHAARDQLAVGMPLEAARAALGLPDRRLVEVLAAESRPGGELIVSEGYIRRPAAPAQRTGGEAAPDPGAEGAPEAGGGTALPAPVAAAVRALRAELAASPFRAPEAGRLGELGLDRKAVAAAARGGLLLRISPQIVLAPGADALAARILARLPQPFTTAQARQALGTSRRVVIPLLEYLDRASATERLPDDRRRLKGR